MRGPGAAGGEAGGRRSVRRGHIECTSCPCMRIQHGAIALALLLAVALAVVVLLPDFVRGRLEARIEALTSRATTIADVDLDLFARRLVVHDLRVHGAAG